mmetsp:Transcript_3941/g.5688  ORF Transcript_3941/g.5688 Transcript_3941/m.5688 type:complete len:88 (+) Transcript_3941:74-337(+)
MRKRLLYCTSKKKGAESSGRKTKKNLLTATMTSTNHHRLQPRSKFSRISTKKTNPISKKAVTRSANGNVLQESTPDENANTSGWTED